ncbi:uncharacterized protein ACOB6Z_000337 [Ctenodactylus gundi]
MKPGNYTSVSAFLLLGLTEQQRQQPLLFGIFLGMYLVTVVGNMLIILAIGSDSHLHTPMYFFLANFSLTDLCLSTTTVPSMLANIQAHSHSIPYAGCLSQVYFFLWFIGLDVFLLAVMAYDRLVAICYPLRYTLLMSPRCCILLVTTSLALTQSYSLTHAILLSQLSFCMDNIIPHFFCELLPLLKLSCSDIYASQCVLIYWGGALTVLIPLLIVISYVRIVATILRVPSAGGKWKAFSTCGSHLSAVCLFYTSAIGVYFVPSAADSGSKDRAAAVMYAVVTPMLNPFIYSLRNKDIKSALRRQLCRGALQLVLSAAKTRHDDTRRLRGEGSFVATPVQPRMHSKMNNANWTHVSHFVLLGISTHPAEQIPLFLLFLLMYTISVSGNGAIITLIIWASRLHTPMYFFLSNLALADICFTSTTVPKMLQNIFSPTKTITYMGCLAQTYFFICFAALENFLLAVMAYDRYIAICHPFHYPKILTGMLCAQLVAVCHVLSHLHALLHTLLMGRLLFCAENRIPHFFCDLYPLMKISCTSTHLNTLMIHTEGVIIINGALAFITASYACIVSAVRRISSTKGKWRAFSTCGSHLTVVAIFYGTLTWVYFRPLSRYSVTSGRIVTVMYTVVTPMLNPFIYSLRNGDVKGAFSKWMSRIWNRFLSLDKIQIHSSEF